MEGSQPEYPHLSSKESRIKRYKPIWRVLLISNLALGAYMFAMARKKNMRIQSEKAEKKREQIEKDSEDIPATSTPIPEIPPPPPVVVRPKEPIPEEQQRELFKWILEEKRKVKPKDREEKKRIDEEKAILKQFIRSESIPNL
ncbi:hypothetical protein Tsubulata_028621 [Turnera subulata]|uniref:Transmembrane protein n=1 Tax=Turnera subulata TaxID=218843 RepID=A0A9Q0J7Y6_9ROSI|nr:hypothetical protein Tsubulata_028621 [Turnera subulata]